MPLTVIQCGGEWWLDPPPVMTPSVWDELASITRFMRLGREVIDLDAIMAEWRWEAK